MNHRVLPRPYAAGGAGAITAALFLQHFAGDVPWAHVDFASAAESPADRHEWTAGPSGFGPRLLLAWLGSEDPLEGIECARAAIRDGSGARLLDALARIGQGKATT